MHQHIHFTTHSCTDTGHNAVAEATEPSSIREVVAPIVVVMVLLTAAVIAVTVSLMLLV